MSEYKVEVINQQPIIEVIDNGVHIVVNAPGPQGPPGAPAKRGPSEKRIIFIADMTTPQEVLDNGFYDFALSQYPTVQEFFSDTVFFLSDLGLILWDGWLPTNKFLAKMRLVPMGGKTGQVLMKLSDDDLDVGWVTL